MGTMSWVTLATNDSYCLGALVLAHSLKSVQTVHKITILITSGVTTAMRESLSRVFDHVKEVNLLDSQDEENLKLLSRPELGITFTKLNCWKLVEFEKCVFLDADTMVLQNCDELFDRAELSAAPDVGWPDCFNSGVFVFQPSSDTYKALIEFALQYGSFDGGDQGVLNMFFKDWSTKDISKHLPFVYNLCSAAIYSYLPAFKYFGKDIKIMHFIGKAKPWLQCFNPETRTVTSSPEYGHLTCFYQLWWNLFCRHVLGTLSDGMAGLAKSFSEMKLGEALTSEQLSLESELRRMNWEHGNIEYMGRDAFANIWQKIISNFDDPEQFKSSNLQELEAMATSSEPTEIQKETAREIGGTSGETLTTVQKEITQETGATSGDVATGIQKEITQETGASSGDMATIVQKETTQEFGATSGDMATIVQKETTQETGATSGETAAIAQKETTQETGATFGDMATIVQKGTTQETVATTGDMTTGTQKESTPEIAASSGDNIASKLEREKTPLKVTIGKSAEDAPPTPTVIGPTPPTSPSDQTNQEKKDQEGTGKVSGGDA